MGPLNCIGPAVLVMGSQKESWGLAAVGRFPQKMVGCKERMSITACRRAPGGTAMRPNSSGARSTMLPRGSTSPISTRSSEQTIFRHAVLLNVWVSDLREKCPTMAGQDKIGSTVSNNRQRCQGPRDQMSPFLHYNGCCRPSLSWDSDGVHQRTARRVTG